MKLAGMLQSLLGEPPGGSGKGRRRWIAWLSLALAAALLYLAVRGLDWQVFLAVLRNANYLLLPVALAWGTLTYLVRAARWRVLLAAEENIPVRLVFWANMAGYLGNAVLPARSGDVIRAAYLGRTTSLSISFAFATGLVERLVDLVALIVIGSASLAWGGSLSGPLRLALTTVAVLGMIGLAVMLVLPLFASPVNRSILALPFLSQTWRENLARLAAQFLLGLKAIMNLRRASLFLLMTGAIWLMDGLGAMLVGYMLHLPLALREAFVLLAGLGLSSAIPSTPGYVGVYQFVAKAVLVPFGFSPADALAYILFAQALGLIVVASWGGVALWKISRTLLQPEPASPPEPQPQ